MALKKKEGINWVEIDSNLLPEQPAPGTIVEFRFTEKFKEYRQQGNSYDRFKNEVALPSIFNLQDGKNIIQVGLVGSYDNQGNVNVGEVVQLSFRPQELGGVLYLTPVADDGSIDQDALDKFYALSLHPQVADNSNKQTINPVMRLVDNVTEAKKNRDARNKKREAMTLALGLNGAQLERAALLLGKAGIKDEELLRDAIEAEADKNPEHFVSALNDENGDIKANFQKAVDAGVIFVDIESSQIKYSGNKNQMLGVDNPTDMDSVKSQYVDYANTDSGKKVNEQVKKLIEMEDRKAAKSGKSGGSTE